MDELEALLYRFLDVQQDENRQLDPYERGPPHDNYGQRPRDDDSDNDSDDDDFRHPPGARIRRPVTPSAGPIPLPDHWDVARPGNAAIRPIVNIEPEETRGLGPGLDATLDAGPVPLPHHLDVARPGFAAIRPIVNIEPEETRGLGPGTAAAPATDPPPDLVFGVDQIDAVVRLMGTRFRGEGQPIQDELIPDEPIPPTRATAFTNRDPDYIPTFDEMNLTAKALKEQYDEYTASQSFSTIIRS